MAVPAGLRVARLQSLGNCEVNVVADRLARAARIPVGIEALPGCRLKHWWWPTVADDTRNQDVSLNGTTWRQALDQTFAESPFQWRLLDGVLVIRPASAWSDSGNVLSRHAAAFQASGTLADAVLPALFHAVGSGLAVPYRRVGGFGASIDQALSVAFGGGTFLDAMVTVARTHGAISWQFSYPTSANDDAMLTVYSLSSPNQVIAPPLRIQNER